MFLDFTLSPLSNARLTGRWLLIAAMLISGTGRWAFGQWDDSYETRSSASSSRSGRMLRDRAGVDTLLGRGYEVRPAGYQSRDLERYEADDDQYGAAAPWEGVAPRRTSASRSSSSVFQADLLDRAPRRDWQSDMILGRTPLDRDRQDPSDLWMTRPSRREESLIERDDWLSDRDYRTRRPARDWEAPFERLAPQPRMREREDLGPVRQDTNYVPAMPAVETRPLLPTQRPAPRTTPAPTATPTLSEKITKRFSDPRVLRMLDGFGGGTGAAMYREVSQFVDTRHIQPTDPAQRTQLGLNYLQEGLRNEAFLRAAGAQGYGVAARLSPALQQLSSMSARNGAESLQVLQQAEGLFAQAGLRPSIVSLAFVYGTLDSLDQYSMLVPAEKSGTADLGLSGQLVGIGVELESNERGLRILKALPGGPAAEAKLTKGDIITAVDGQSLAGLDLSQAVEYITGSAGSPIQLELRRNSMIGNVTLTRRPVQIRSVSDVRMVDAANGVGYIKMDQFGETTAQELDQALWSLHNQNMQSLVLDLRGNPGGLLTTAIAVADRFLPSGTIVSTRGRTVNDNSQEAANYAETWNVPLVVLVDHNSASASEILAAAVQENRRGLILGQTSYGKGTVQTLFPLSSTAAALRLTTAKFYSPTGQEMAGRGVTPDIRLNAVDDDTQVIEETLAVLRDPQTQQYLSQLQQVGQSNVKRFTFSTGDTEVVR